MIDVFWDDRVLAHDTGAGLFEAPASPLLEVQERHPENAERVRNMKSVLERGPIAHSLRWHHGRLADTAELATVHDPAYVESIRAACEAGGGPVTGTTFSARAPGSRCSPPRARASPRQTRSSTAPPGSPTRS
jgi:acetoin utilization deacetylase AcuC-like enzyme